MRIAVMGAGGIGGCLGAHLARAGNDVTLIARGAHLEAIRKNGLRLKSHNGDFTVETAATDDPSQVGPVDLVLFTVKTYHNAQAIPLMKPLVGERPVVMTLQNGVESHEELGRAFGIGHVMPGAAYVAATVQAPGVIVQESHDAPSKKSGLPCGGSSAARNWRRTRGFSDGASAAISTSITSSPP